MNKNRFIASAKAFLPKSNFPAIVTLLDINPEKDWKHWRDIEGNQLIIRKNKGVVTYISGKNSYQTNDIFRKALPLLISQNSYWVLAMFGDEITILNFVGNDGLLRSCYFEKNEWKYNFKSIFFGFNVIEYVAQEYLEEECKKVKLKTNFEINEMWSTAFPSENSYIQEKIQWLVTNQNLKEL